MATDIKFVMVATGFDEDHPATFTSLGTRHVQFMVRQLNATKGKASSPLTPPALVRFVHFDWQNDRISVYEHPFPAKGVKKPRVLWKELSTFTSTEGTTAEDPTTFITKSAIVTGNLHGISIVDIYRAVRGAPRGSVLDVSIYSHGFIDGPVLENSGDSQLTAAGGEPIRTASDLDGRARSDFTPHMGEADPVANKDALKDFREGFAPNATFRVFGCHVQDIVDGSAFGESTRSLIRSTVLQVIHAAFIVQLQKKTAAGNELRKKKKPATVSLDMGLELAIEDSINDTSVHLTNFNKTQLRTLHYRLDSAFFPDPTNGALAFDRPFTEVVKFVARQTKLGYIFKAAEALPDVTCFGAVPGSGGDFERGGNQLMFVPADTWGLVLMFFQNFMGIVLDARNYGTFDAAGVAAINDRETNG